MYSELLDEQCLIDRKNYKWHVTASCYLLSQDSKKVIFIFNKNSQKFLQPGWHSENSDKSPLHTAKRELEEETGIKTWDYEILSKVPIDINTHKVPKNISKSEDSHLHHDFRFLFRLVKNPNIFLQKEEVESFKWIDICDEDYIRNYIYQRIKNILTLKQR